MENDEKSSYKYDDEINMNVITNLWIVSVCVLANSRYKTSISLTSDWNKL